MTLYERILAATGPDKHLGAEIMGTAGYKIVYDQIEDDWYIETGLDEDGGPWEPCLDPTNSVDAALGLLGPNACNQFLHSCGADGGWSFTFHDTTRTVGDVEADNQVEVMCVRVGGTFQGLSTPMRAEMKAIIAQRYMDFYCLSAATPALAICAAVAKREGW